MSRHTYRINFIIILMFFIGLSSCCKDKNPFYEGCQDKAPQEMGHFNLDTVKPYIYFKEGSWWVYENDSTLEQDSIVVTYSDDIILESKGLNRHYTYESTYIVTHSYYNDYTVRLFNTGSNPDMVDWSFYLYWKRDRSKSGDFQGPVLNFSTLYDTGQILGHDTYFRGKLESVQFLNNIYNDVLVYEVRNDPTFPDSKIPTLGRGRSTYYYAKNIGIVAIKNIDADQRYTDNRLITQTWKLKKYYIKP